MIDLLSIEIYVLIFTGICSLIFWKHFKENKTEIKNNKSEGYDIYSKVFMISIIISILDLIFLIPLTIIF